MARYSVTANVSGEPARIQERDGRTTFDIGEARQFQEDLRRSGFDRVDIIEAQDKPAGAITAPASKPDIRGGKPVTIEIDPQTGAEIQITGATQEQIEQQRNVERAIAQRPQIASIRETLRSQILQPSPPRAEIDRRQARAQRIAEEASRGFTAEEIIRGTESRRGFRDLPAEYQTPETLKSIAEVSAQRQQIIVQEPPQSIKREGEFIGGDGRDRHSIASTDLGISDSFNNLVSQKEEKRVQRFEERIRTSEERQSQFFGSKGFERIRETAAVLTGGIRRSKLRGDLEIIPFEQRGFIGKRAENLISGAMSFPIAIGGALPLVGEKLAATGEAITIKETRSQVLPELIRTGKVTATPFLKPFSEEGADIYLAAGTFGLLGVGGRSPLKVRTLEIPKAEAIAKPSKIFKELGIEEAQVLKPEVPAKVTLVGFETKGGRAVVLGAKTPEGFKFGTPDVLPILERSSIAKMDIKVGSALETATLQKALRQLPTRKEQVILPTMQTIIRKTARTQPKVRALPKETERLSPEGVSIVLDIAKQKEGVVFGGFSRGSQLAERVTRKQDVVYHGTSKEAAELILKEGLKPAIELGEVRGLAGGKQTKISTLGKQQAELFGDIYLTPDIKMAKTFAGRKGKVLEVKLTKKQLTKAEIEKSPLGIDIAIKGKIKPTQISELGGLSKQTFEVIPRLRDIDIRFSKAGAEELTGITQLTLGRLRETGIKAREVKDIPFAIEVKQPSGKFEKAVEFKGKEEIIKGEAVPEFVVGIRKEGKPIKTREGTKITGLPEELRGVAQGVLRVTKRKGQIEVFPPPKRVKDIGSFVVSARTLEQKRFLPSRKLTGAIEQFETLFPEELLASQLKAIQKGKTRVELADFSKPVKEVSPIRVYPVAPKSQISISQVSVSESISLRKDSLSLASPKSLIYQSAKPSPSAKSLSGLSASPSKSRSISKSISSSLGKSFSGSPSVSPSLSPSLSISPSPSLTPSPSLFPSPSPSPRPSPSPSPSPYPSPPPPTTTTFTPPLYFPKSDLVFGTQPKKKERKGRREFFGTPSLSVVGLGSRAAGTELTKGQLRGTEPISPFAIRKIPKRARR